MIWGHSGLPGVMHFYNVCFRSPILAPLVRELFRGNILPVSGQSQGLRKNTFALFAHRTSSSVIVSAVLTQLCFGNNLTIPSQNQRSRKSTFARYEPIASSAVLVSPAVTQMRRFFDTCQNNQIVSALLRQLSFGNNLLAAGQSQRLRKNAFARCGPIASSHVIVSAVLTQMRLAVRGSFEGGHCGGFLVGQQGVHDE